jgi:hypothetical protein
MENHTSEYFAIRRRGSKLAMCFLYFFAILWWVNRSKQAYSYKSWNDWLSRHIGPKINPGGKKEMGFTISLFSMNLSAHFCEASIIWGVGLNYLLRTYSEIIYGVRQHK